jgi:hypothetical protein
MSGRGCCRRGALLAGVAVATLAASPILAGQARADRGATSTWTPPRTTWGDPDIQGTFTNKDEFNTPLERPAEFAGRTLQDFSPAELARLNQARQEQHRKVAPGIGGADTGAGPTHWFESFTAVNSRPWLIVDPADGMIPAMTPDGARREAAVAARNAARNGEGVADSWEDRSMWDRCITRGFPGSMMPNIYGNAYQIEQAPGYVTITYEMIHETRIIPIGAGPHLPGSIRLYTGDARGRWEGNTLVVETTNFNSRNHWGYNNRYTSDAFRLTERFTPIGPDRLLWEVTMDDPKTWVRPWTFGMPLARNEGHAVFEYACHEGNYGLVNILSGARAEEKR